MLTHYYAIVVCALVYANYFLAPSPLTPTNINAQNALWFPIFFSFGSLWIVLKMMETFFTDLTQACFPHCNSGVDGGKKRQRLKKKKGSIHLAICCWEPLVGNFFVMVNAFFYSSFSSTVLIEELKMTPRSRVGAEKLIPSKLRTVYLAVWSKLWRVVRAPDSLAKLFSIG